MIYLDNASTTKPCRAAVEAVINTAEQFGNPSSLHKMGLEAEKILKQSKDTIASILGINSKNLYFTSGGTESNNTAILGCCMANEKRGRHVITTKIEHPSVSEPFRILELSGFEVTYLNVDENGIFMPDELEQALRDDTILVSIMHVNNETGMIQPIEQVKQIIKKKSPKAVFHVDAVQSFCKIEVKPKQWGVDMMSISGHKIHAFKGIGALYIENAKIRPVLHGGGQQNGIRPGTENMPGIASFGAAAACVDIHKNRVYMSSLRTRLKDRLLSEIKDIKINGNDAYASGNILNVSFSGIKAEILLHSVETKGLYISTGSACSSNKPKPSHVLTAMGCTPKQIQGAVRFSLHEGITEQDIDETVRIVKEEVTTIRKYVR